MLRRCDRCQFVKPYFAYFVGEALSIHLIPIMEPIVNLVFLVLVPFVVYRKKLEELGFKNFRRGFFFGLSAFIFLPFLRFPLSPFPFVDAFAQSLFFKGFFYSVFENEMLFWKFSRLNLISSFLYFLVFLGVSGSFLAVSYFVVSVITGILYEESGSLLSSILFHTGFFISTLSVLFR